MTELLLLSNSRAPGQAFLEHAAGAIRSVLGGRTQIVFVPFASGDPGAYADLMRKALASLGIGVRVDSLHEASDPARAVREAEAFFVGGGNSFRLLRALRRLDLLDSIRDAGRNGAHYLDPDPGSSHRGETRQQRIEEFLEENDVPVLGLREGAWLGVSGDRAILAGASTGRLFRRGVPPANVPAGTDLSFLFETVPRFDVRAAR